MENYNHYMWNLVHLNANNADILGHLYVIIWQQNSQTNACHSCGKVHARFKLHTRPPFLRERKSK